MFQFERRGISLVETLILIVVGGILVGVLLPAVQTAREVTRRAQCAENLRQLAMACLDYESAHKKLPPGWIHRSHPELSMLGSPESVNAKRSDHTPKNAESMPAERASWGWSGMILPYLNESNLYNRLNGCGPTDLHLVFESPIEDMVSAMQTPLAVYRCPSDRAPPVNVGRVFGSHRNKASVATSNYVGNGGSWTLHWRDLKRSAGMFHGTEAITLGSVEDGLSNTVMLTERRWQYATPEGEVRLARAANVFGVTRTRYRGRGISDQLASARAKLNFDGVNENRARRGASSHHGGGGLFALCDGSVQFLSEDVDHEYVEDRNHQNWGWSRNSAANSTYERLFNRRDGGTIGDTVWH